MSKQETAQIKDFKDAVIAKGREAWQKEKQSAEQSRQRWLLIGAALIKGKGSVGRYKFGQWCEENGFGDLEKTSRGAAIWLHKNWGEVDEVNLPKDLSHPRHIRDWYNEQLKAQEQPKEKPHTSKTQQEQEQEADEVFNEEDGKEFPPPSYVPMSFKVAESVVTYSGLAGQDNGEGQEARRRLEKLASEFQDLDLHGQSG